MQEFTPEFLQPILYMESSCLLIVSVENQGNTVKYYIGNTLEDPTHCPFTYTKIAYHKKKQRDITERKVNIMYEKQEIS